MSLSASYIQRGRAERRRSLLHDYSAQFGRIADRFAAEAALRLGKEQAEAAAQVAQDARDKAEAANRAMEESELLKLRLELRKIKDQLDQVHEDIGERTVRLTEQGSTLDAIKTDREITAWIEDVRKLRDQGARIEADMYSILSM